MEHPCRVPTNKQGGANIKARSPDCGSSYPPASPLAGSGKPPLSWPFRSPFQPYRQPSQTVLKLGQARKRRGQGDAQRDPGAHSSGVPRFKLRLLPPSSRPLYCRMFPHPGTRLVRPTNGCRPPSGHVLEVLANGRARSRVVGRALSSSSGDWRVWEEWGRRRDGTGRRRAPRREGSNRALRHREWTVASRARREELKGWGGARAGVLPAAAAPLPRGAPETT